MFFFKWLVIFVCVSFRFFISILYVFVFFNGFRFFCCKFFNMVICIIVFLLKFLIIVGIVFFLVSLDVWKCFFFVMILYFFIVEWCMMIGWKMFDCLIELVSFCKDIFLNVLCGWYGFGCSLFNGNWIIVLFFIFIVFKFFKFWNNVLIFWFNFLFFFMIYYFFC